MGASMRFQMDSVSNIFIHIGNWNNYKDNGIVISRALGLMMPPANHIIL